MTVDEPLADLGRGDAEPGSDGGVVCRDLLVVRLARCDVAVAVRPLVELGGERQLASAVVMLPPPTGAATVRADRDTPRRP